jgi:hypothetical protein
MKKKFIYQGEPTGVTLRTEGQPDEEVFLVTDGEFLLEEQNQYVQDLMEQKLLVAVSISAPAPAPASAPKTIIKKDE